MRPKTKFLTVVWGKAYITRFANLALPSFIAPGNLPALAEATDLEVVIMTRRDDIAHFECQETFERLRTICPVRFVDIDDLITTSAYGVTLTLAYARPIIACGSEMLNTHFVFMNADFVLADGSLRSLARHIVEGRTIVLGPSFRATAEEVEPLLENAMDRPAGVLSIPPRQMTALAMPHPHPTTVAKTLTQGLCHSTHPNQFFWQVDRNTLLARYYLIFMLCLKPERVLESVNSFCDYSFIPEMCPSGDEAVMDDSDDFFMLELQEREQEIEMLRLGSQSPEETVASLQTWTTKEHRRASTHDIIFHTEDIPPGVASTKAVAQAFVSDINSRLAAPVQHHSHPYWIRGERAWASYRTAQKLSSNPSELSVPARRKEKKFNLRAIKYRIRRSFWTIAYLGHRVLTSRKTAFSLINPDYQDIQLLQKTLASFLKNPGPNAVIVRDKPELTDHLVSRGSGIEFATITDWLKKDTPAIGINPGVGSSTFIYMTQSAAPHFKRVLERCHVTALRGGDCHVVIHEGPNRGQTDGLVTAILPLIEAIREITDLSVKCRFTGGTLKRFHRNFLSFLGRRLIASGLPSLLWILPLLALELPAIYVSNFCMRSKYPSNGSIESCSSVAIHIQSVEHPARSTRKNAH